MTEIILASGSQARKNMLQAAGVDFKAIPADVDEATLIENTQDPEHAATLLAQQKAQHISQQHQNALVIGSDQILECDGDMFCKAPDKSAAIKKLKTLQGRTHTLISAVSIAQNGKILWSHTSTARMTMHALSNDFITRYAEAAGDILTQCVGGYAYEEHGAWLFKKIEGDYFTILGMPLLPLLTYLRENHGVTP